MSSCLQTHILKHLRSRLLRVTFRRLGIATAGLTWLASGCSRTSSDVGQDQAKDEQTTTQQQRLSLQLARLNSLSAQDSASEGHELFYARIEGRQTSVTDLASLLARITTDSGHPLQAQNFRLTDERTLQTSLYRRYVQTAQVNANSQAYDVDGTSLRIWSDLHTGRLILAEAFLRPETPVEAAATPATAGADKGTQAPESPSISGGTAEILARRDLATFFRFGQVRSVTSQVVLQSTHQGLEARQRVRVKTKSGSWILDYDTASGTMLSKKFRDVSHADRDLHSRHAGPSQGTYALPAQVYPLWELPASAPDLDAPATPTTTELVNLLESVPSVSLGSALSAGSFNFKMSKKLDSGLSPSQILKGYWNNELITFLFPDPWNSLAPQLGNKPGRSPILRLYGRNVVVMLHPDVAQLLSTNPQAAQTFAAAPKFIPKYESSGSEDNDDTDVTLRYAPLKWGVPIRDSSELLRRSPFSSDGVPHPERTAELVQAGFDEAQVYYATDAFLSTFQDLGFADPELSTTPFVAILFDPDIESRDNAYYTDNTINFATYSAGEMNMARDNTTIWHELGHALQDRLMGPHLDSEEGYGLWEGMADFLAQLVIAQRFGLEPFAQRETLRILNRTHFYMTNESHDEGEAYGGAMNTMLENVMQHFGAREGLLRMADLTLETMRLTRDHPRLTAAVWFEQMKYVDSLVRPELGFQRQAGELLPFVELALSRRNYAAGKSPAAFEVRYGSGSGTLLTDRSPGSRGEPIVLNASGPELQRFPVRVTLKDGDDYHFQFPVTVRITTTGSPLQGAVRWEDESGGPRDFVLSSTSDVAEFELGADSKNCDFVNRSNGGCKDYVHILLLDSEPVIGQEKRQPIGKKRFYVAVPR